MSGPTPSRTRKRGRNKFGVPSAAKIKEKTYSIHPATKHYGVRQDFYGWFCSQNEEILFREGMTKFDTVDTVIHEILHGLIYEYGIKFDHWKKEEATVTRLSTALTEFIIDNPKFMLWLMRCYKSKEE